VPRVPRRASHLSFPLRSTWAAAASLLCARSERPRRRPCRSDETRAPDERDPLVASAMRLPRSPRERASSRSVPLLRVTKKHALACTP
jgi:hypothetical protein